MSPRILVCGDVVANLIAGFEDIPSVVPSHHPYKLVVVDLAVTICVRLSYYAFQSVIAIHAASLECTTSASSLWEMSPSRSLSK